jgi:hypothetical protein
MLEQLRKFFQSKAGAATAGAVVLVALIALFFSMRGMFTSEAGALSAERVYIDEHGNSFTATAKPGVPIKGKDGGPAYIAELCYWTKDGKPKSSPTPVLLNESLGKKEPTFCPDCGRLVVGRNPRAGPGVKPPPTKAEYKPRGSDRR